MVVSYDLMMNKIICPFCNKEAKFCENKEIYGRNYGKSYMCYFCKDCDAYVWTHNNTEKPYWTLANKETRNARHLCHELLDPLWKNVWEWDYKSGTRWEERKRLYKMIAEKMNIPIEEMHFGMFDIEKCREAYRIILSYKKSLDE